MQAKGVIDDVGRHLAMKWDEKHPNSTADNPWSLKRVAQIKAEFDTDPERTKQKYPDLFYYFDGLLDTKISQSVHPAGIVISPITLDDNIGVFDKENENCLMLDMENIHDFTGLAKFDFLILKTVQVIRDTCKYLNQPYPKTHEINWDDQAVWDSIIKSPCGIFQFEGKYAFDCLKKFQPHSIFDMSLVTASIRPTGASYRDDLLSRKVHSNPSEIIDKLLANNLGYLVYQEDTIAFLQQICGLSGSAADNIRRAIGRKQKDRLDAAMPSILEGYCSKSDRPREIAEQEAKEFLQVIEDSASYQFGYNHSIAYCLLGYLCAYYRYYHPVEFITSFLNNAANETDIKNGTQYAKLVGINVTMPKWGYSKSEYFFDTENRVIAKGLSSVKFMNNTIAEELYNLAHGVIPDSNLLFEGNGEVLGGISNERFVDVLHNISNFSSLNTRQLDILIKIDFFSRYGNQRELLMIADYFYSTFKRGEAKQISKEKVDGTPLQPIIEKYSVGFTKNGTIAKNYTLIDTKAILDEIEDAIKAAKLADLDDLTKVKNFKEVMGYIGYTSNKEEDRRKLYILDMFPVYRKKDNKQFGYSILTKSIGSGVESRFTVFNTDYNRAPIRKDDVIYCSGWSRDGQYFKLTDYKIIGRG